MPDDKLELGRRIGEVVEELVLNESTEPIALSAAVETLAEALATHDVGSTFFQEPLGRTDQLVALGEQVELSAEVRPLLGLAVREIRFIGRGPSPASFGEARRAPERALPETLIGLAPLQGARRAYRIWVPQRAGLWRIDAERLTRDGRVLEHLLPEARPLVQVVEPGVPVAVIDASLVIEARWRELEGLRNLLRRGWQLCYVDLESEGRGPALRLALRSMGLPDGALFEHPGDPGEFDPLSVDFRPVLASLNFRRLRAYGAALVLYVGRTSRCYSVARAAGLTGIEFEDLPELLGDSPRLQRLCARSEAFEARRSSTPSRHRWVLDQMTGVEALEGNECSFELDNRAAREAVFEALERAARSVHLQFYIFKDGRFTRELAARLVRCARRGVQVRLLVDGLYSGQELLGLSNTHLEGLKQEPGISVVAVDAIRDPADLDRVRLKQRDHRKLLIVDDELALVSGRNGGDEYYTGFDEVPVTDWTPAGEIPWLDAHVALRGPLVAQIQRCFQSCWLRNGGQPILEPRAAPRSGAATARRGGCTARLVIRDGVEDADGLAAYEAIIEGAERQLYVVNDFPVVSALADALRRAVLRGVRVVFLTGNAVPRRADGTFFKGELHRELFEYLTKDRFEALMDVGVELWEYACPPHPLLLCRGDQLRPYVHAKVLVADEQVASVGSANLDATASYWEREALVVVEDAAFAAALAAEIEGALALSYRVDPRSEYWESEATQRTLVSRLWPRAVLP